MGTVDTIGTAVLIVPRLPTVPLVPTIPTVPLVRTVSYRTHSTYSTHITYNTTVPTLPIVSMSPTVPIVLTVPILKCLKTYIKTKNQSRIKPLIRDYQEGFLNNWGITMKLGLSLSYSFSVFPCEVLHEIYFK